MVAHSRYEMGALQKYSKLFPLLTFDKDLQSCYQNTCPIIHPYIALTAPQVIVRQSSPLEAAVQAARYIVAY
jgi:hypothetical protein